MELSKLQLKIYECTIKVKEIIEVSTKQNYINSFFN